MVNNIKWKIATLEAQSGLKPTIKQAYKRKHAEGLDGTDEPNEQVENQLYALKVERVKMKLHSIQKFLKKSIKKAIAFHTQDIVKRLKRAREMLGKGKEKIEQAQKDNCDVTALTKSQNKLRNRILSLEKQLKHLKEFNLDIISNIMVYHMIKTNKEHTSNPLLQSIFNDMEVGVLKNFENSEDLKSVYIAMTTDQPDNSNALKKHMKTPMEAANLDLIACLKEMANEKQSRQIRAAKRKRDDLLTGRSKESGNHHMIGPISDQLIEGSDWNHDRNMHCNQHNGKGEVDRGCSEDDDNDNMDIATTDLKGQEKPKKNRPGQQARRKLWEAKYGKEAKHLSAMDQLIGHSRAYNNNCDRKENKQTMNSGGANSSMNVESLHPSWQAKIKQQAQLQAKPQGKKIVFNDL